MSRASLARDIDLARGMLGEWGQFGLVLTNTLYKMKTKDIFTYHGKGPHGGWHLIDYIAIRRKHLLTFYCTKVLRGARKLYPSADHHLVRCELALWQNPIWRRSSRRGTGGSRPRLAIAGSRHQVAESLSKLSLSGLRWKEASSEIYQTVRTVVGTTRQKAKYWVYDHRE